MRHPAFKQPDSILEKLRHFHHEHGTPMDRVLLDLEATVDQLPYNTRVAMKRLSSRKFLSNRQVVVAAVLPLASYCRQSLRV